MQMNKDIENAIALLYEREIHNAPIVISKGEKLLAKRMVEVAKKYDIPIVEDDETASILMELDIGEEIPYSLYEAVSVILSHVYKLKAEL